MDGESNAGEPSMPPRWLCLAIVIFWLGTTGPLVWEELISPLWRSDQPPPYTLDLTAEAQGEKAKILWVVHVGDGEPDRNVLGHKAESWVKYHDDSNTYSFHTELKASQRQDLKKLALGPITLRSVMSSERVDARGRLREMHVEAMFDTGINLLGVDNKLSVTVDGKVENNVFAPGIVASLSGVPFSLPAPTIQMPEGGSVELPLHLVNRLSGLRPGLSWQAPMLDYLKTSSNYFTGTLRAELRYVRASVQAEIQELPGSPDIRCHVIDYDTEAKQRTWVQVGTDLVIRQEAEYEGLHIIVQRFNLPHDR
jgi:hypothetical protein